MACIMLHRELHPVPEQSSDCLRMSTLHEHEPTNVCIHELQEPANPYTQQSFMLKLCYADIIWPISTILPRVNLKRFLKAETML